MVQLTSLKALFAKLRRSKDNTLPQYSQLYPTSPALSIEQHSSSEPLAVLRLRRFVTWRLANDYHLRGKIPKHDIPCPSEYSYFTGLCRKYSMLLAKRFETDLEVESVKLELERDVFDPAKLLGIPADVMEAFLFITRSWIVWYPQKLPRSITTIQKAQDCRNMLLTRCALDYHIIITAVTIDSTLACDLMVGCLELHNKHLAKYINPKYLFTPTLDLSQQPSWTRNYENVQWPNVQALRGQVTRLPACSKRTKKCELQLSPQITARGIKFEDLIWFNLDIDQRGAFGCKPDSLTKEEMFEVERKMQVKAGMTVMEKTSQ